MNAMDRAISQKEAIGAAARIWEAALAMDSRYQFLLRTAKEAGIKPSDRIDQMDYLVEHMNTGAPYRRRRAVTLLQLRKAYLFNGHRGIVKALPELRRLRANERLNDSLSVMAAEHAAGFVGTVPVVAGAAIVEWEGE